MVKLEQRESKPHNSYRSLSKQYPLTRIPYIPMLIIIIIIIIIIIYTFVRNYIFIVVID